MSSFEMLVGTVDEVEGHYVATMFITFPGPLFPMKSMYVHSTDVSRVAGGTTTRYSGRDLPLAWSSVLLGYARVWLALATFAMPFVLMWGQAVDFDLSRWEWLVTIATGIAWLISFVPGRLGAERKKQLACLGRAMGAYLDPRHVDAIGRHGMCAMMEPNLRAQGLEPDAPSLQRGIVRANGRLLELIYAYGAWAALDAPEYRAVENEAWSKIQRG